MRIYLHIGPEQVGAARLQNVLADKREQLAHKGILFPRSPGGKNHTRLYMAVTDPDHIDPLRFNRGHMTAEKQRSLYNALGMELARDVAQANPHRLILSASQLGASLHRRSELERLRDLLRPLSDDIRIIAHVDEPAHLLTRIYAAQIMEGRAAPLSRDLVLADSASWWQDALQAAPTPDPQAGQFLETQAPPFWLDFTALQAFWEDVFGAGSVTFRPYDADRFYGAEATEELRAAFDIKDTIGRAVPVPVPTEPSAAWLARGRQLNDLLLRVLESRKKIIPRSLWRTFLSEIAIGGDPIFPGSLAPLARAFDAHNKALIAAHPALTTKTFRKAHVRKEWSEADPEMGYRASQYLLGFMHRINKATKEARKTMGADLDKVNGADPVVVADPVAAPAPVTPVAPPKAKPEPTDPHQLSEAARKIMPPLALEKFEGLRGSSYAPHNRLGQVDEEQLAGAYTPLPPRDLPKGSSGNVIVGCMKNEAPYIVEWVAYHRAMGVDNFLIYTNDCSDGTSEILDRLQEMGVLQHRNNDNWKGNSPQQYALNQALKEPVIKNADWIIHIDVDEFMNVRTGNGTLDDFFAAVPDATNVAMTWRLFGHNGVTRLADDFVIDQFDSCAPKYCPKPHTVWGFKTMFKNIGAYEKISCHRPNKLDEGLRGQVKWVNGSGRDMTHEAADNGWRNSKKSIGYDLLQLNHYALRSAESYLIKRQRGRALHVDRSIGLNYWIRMDWCDYRDITIKRNLPRMRAEYDRLMADASLRKWHDHGFAWHQAKAQELHGMDEFEDLYKQALTIDLTETERVAYALALDLES